MLKKLIIISVVAVLIVYVMHVYFSCYRLYNLICVKLSCEPGWKSACPEELSACTVDHLVHWCIVKLHHAINCISACN